jgi:hypothetical protein
MTNTGPDTGKCTLHAARYFSASPTWNRWNKLTALDIYTQLREEPNFQGQNVWFWLNHPIQFVRVVGYVAQFDMVAGGKYILMTVDDGSGVNIEVKLERPVAYRESNGPVYSTKTSVDDVEVVTEMGLPAVRIRHKMMEIGSVVTAEGKVEKYNTARQLIALRLRFVENTHDEAVYWSKVAEWKRKVLSRPWILDEETKRVIDAKLKEGAKLDEKKGKRKERKSAKIEELRRLHEEKIEHKRRERAEYYDRGALEGTNVLKMPWDG